MEGLQIFKSEEFGQIRTIEVDGEIWFVGKEIADKLEYQNGSRDIDRHVDEEDRKTIMLHDGTQNRNTIIINESGLYSLILGSRLPNAKRFKHWVTAEVLPAIRKTGSYQMPQSYTEALRALLAKAEENERLQLEMVRMNDVIAEMEPKVTYLDKILESKETMLVTQIAQDYGMSARAFNKKLNDLRVQYKAGDQWILYSQYQGNGYVHSHTHHFERNNGQIDCKLNTEWTQKGRIWLYGFLKEHGILPTIEQ